jgi:hypothetical protein
MFAEMMNLAGIKMQSDKGIFVVFSAPCRDRSIRTIEE